MDRSVFLLDACVFIEAAHRYYAFDLAPRFWESLIAEAAKGHILCIDRVRQELERGKDDLSIWAKTNFSDYFASTDDDEVIECYGKIMNWVQTQGQFNDAAKYEFAGIADGWLVAYAMAKGCSVVTLEVLNPEIKKKVPIPNICVEFGISFYNTFEMLRSLQIIFG